MMWPCFQHPVHSLERFDQAKWKPYALFALLKLLLLLGGGSFVLISPGQASSPFALRFEQSEYTITKVESLKTSILVDPVPPDKLFSYSFLVQLTSSSGVIGVISLTPVTSYNYNGPAGEGAVRSSSLGESSARGTSSFFKSDFPALSDGTLANLILLPLPVGVYDLKIFPFTALGANEQLFITGGINVSDSAISFGTATINVINVAAEIASLSVPKRNIQTGLFAHSIKLTNTTLRTPNTLRIWIENLPVGVSVANATGSLSGRSYIDYHKPLRPGVSVTVQVMFRAANQRAIINPRYVVEELSPQPAAPVTLATHEETPSGSSTQTAVISISPQISSSIAAIKPSMTVDRGQPVLEFATKQDTTYVVQYSSDLVNWQPAQPAIVGTGTKARWTDTGPPRTLSLTGKATTARFYRIVPTPTP